RSRRQAARPHRARLSRHHQHGVRRRRLEDALLHDARQSQRRDPEDRRRAGAGAKKIVMRGTIDMRSLETLSLSAVALLASLSIATSSPAQADEGAFVELPSVKLWVTDSGGSGDPIILLHAATGTAETWAKQTPALMKAGYRVIAIDLPGWG